MGKIITIASQKGGVGKTTTALNLGHSLSRFGSRVLLIDGDPQGGMAIASNLSKQTKRGIITMLKESCPPQEIIFTTRDKTMGVVGLGETSPEDVLFLEKEARDGNFGMLIQSLTNGYDYTIIDAPAGVGSIPASLLNVSDSVILVINCRAISLKTIPIFLKLVKSIKEGHNPKLLFDGVVITMLDQRIGVEKQILQQIKSTFPEDAFFKTMIPFDEYFEKAGLYSVPVALMPGGMDAARPYVDLAMELKAKEAKTQKGDEEYEDIVGLF